METKVKKTLEHQVSEQGSYQTARRLINRYVTASIGMGLDDLPDTSELADIVEELAEILEAEPIDRKAAAELLENIDIEALVMG